jgi:hypothetical protein
MKKIENWLLWPILILIFCSISKYGDTATDIHWNDTFYVINNSFITGWFLAWLLIVFFLFKLIRRRHQAINNKFAITFMGGGSPAGYSDSQIDNLIFYNQVRVVTALGLLVTQVIFLVYFVVQLLKKPVIQG